MYVKTLKDIIKTFLKSMLSYIEIIFFCISSLELLSYIAEVSENQKVAFVNTVNEREYIFPIVNRVNDGCLPSENESYFSILAYLRFPLFLPAEYPRTCSLGRSGWPC